MRIVFIGTCFPMRGGIALFNAILAREMARSHEVSFLSFTRQYPDRLFPGKTQYVAEEEAADIARFPAEPVLDSIGPLSWWRTARRAAALQPDVVIFRYWMPFFAPAFGTIARWLKRWTDARIIFVCDNIVPHERRPFDAALTRYALAPGDGFITMSESVRQDLLGFRPDVPNALVHHPVYNVFGERIGKGEARRRLGLEEGPWILFFGFIRRYKGLDLLLQALPLVRRRRPVRLLVAGEFYDDEQRYRDLVRAGGLEDAVVFYSDYIPEDQVAVHFSAADCVALPYHSATQSGIVPVAYHLDTPVICTDVGGLSEVVLDNETGFVVRPDDPGALADAIERFYAEQREEAMREGVRREKRKYSWEPLVAAIERLAGAAPPGGGRSARTASGGGRSAETASKDGRAVDTASGPG